MEFSNHSNKQTAGLVYSVHSSKSYQCRAPSTGLALWHMCTCTCAQYMYKTWQTGQHTDKHEVFLVHTTLPGTCTLCNLIIVLVLPGTLLLMPLKDTILRNGMQSTCRLRRFVECTCIHVHVHVPVYMHMYMHMYSTYMYSTYMYMYAHDNVIIGWKTKACFVSIQA